LGFVQILDEWQISVRLAQSQHYFT
jgi:hypothetical protein